eukprot:scaffold878_cov271-Pinguiococcus_pyrenoidosus.AAC.65
MDCQTFAPTTKTRTAGAPSLSLSLSLTLFYSGIWNDTIQQETETQAGRPKTSRSPWRGEKGPKNTKKLDHRLEL